MDTNNLSCLYFHSNKIQRYDIVWGLLELGIDCRISDTIVDIERIDENQIEQILKDIGLNKAIDFIITQNFSPTLAICAQEKDIPYICWMYDVSSAVLYTKEALYDTNYYFTFERLDITRLKKIGISNIFYSTLAGNVAMASTRQRDDADYKKFLSDISFVGNLYYSENLYSFIDTISEDAYLEYKKSFEEKIFNWSPGARFHPAFSEAFIDYLHETNSFIREERFETSSFSQMAESVLLVPVIANRERCLCLQELARGHNVKLYTSNKFQGEIPDGVEICSPVSPDKDQYNVFEYSKINLNMTISTIETGIIQRVYDIMTVGGFCLSNYRDDARILFEEDKEIVLFQSIEELKDKADYYLRHDGERIKIGQRGKKRVETCYTYPIVLKRIIETTLFGINSN